MPKAETWGEMQRRWGSIVAGYTVEQVKDLICEVTSADDDFATYSLLLILKYRWDCPVAEYEKARLVGKLKHARDRKCQDVGKCEGRKTRVERG